MKGALLLTYPITNGSVQVFRHPGYPQGVVIEVHRRRTGPTSYGLTSYTGPHYDDIPRDLAELRHGIRPDADAHLVGSGVAHG